MSNEKLVVAFFAFFAFFTSKIVEISGFDDEYEYEDPITSCASNNAYLSLESCVKECKKVHLSEEIVFLHYPDEGEKSKYKVVELSAAEFRLDPNGYLLTNLPIQVPRDSFVVAGNGTQAFVCYPLDEDFVNCTKWHLEEHEFELHNNSRYLISIPHNTLHPLGKFYMEKFSYGTDAAVCIPQKVLTPPAKDPVDAMFLAAYAVSAAALALTFALAVAIPELNVRNNLILLCHLVVLTFAYVLLFVRNILTESSRGGCLVIALMQQFTLLASFFWINVQAIDLYVRFINLRGNCDLRTNMKRFVMYSCYAWGGPCVICLITLAMEKTDVQSLRPKFRLHCWFAEKEQLTTFVYFYGPVAVLLFANIFLFILTINKLYRMGKAATNVNKKMHNQLLLLYLKLVVVMGLCWIMEVISWAVGGEKKNWYFTDLINALQGLLIFIVYICKPSYIRRVVYQNSFFPNRPKWWPWQGPAGPKRREEVDRENELETAQKSTNVQENVETHV